MDFYLVNDTDCRHFYSHTGLWEGRNDRDEIFAFDWVTDEFLKWDGSEWVVSEERDKVPAIPPKGFVLIGKIRAIDTMTAEEHSGKHRCLGISGIMFHRLERLKGFHKHSKTLTEILGEALFVYEEVLLNEIEGGSTTILNRNGSGEKLEFALMEGKMTLGPARSEQ